MENSKQAWLGAQSLPTSWGPCPSVASAWAPHVVLPCPLQLCSGRGSCEVSGKLSFKKSEFISGQKNFLKCLVHPMLAKEKKKSFLCKLRLLIVFPCELF